MFLPDAESQLLSKISVEFLIKYMLSDFYTIKKPNLSFSKIWNYILKRTFDTIFPVTNKK